MSLRKEHFYFLVRPSAAAHSLWNGPEGRSRPVCSASQSPSEVLDAVLPAWSDLLQARAQKADSSKSTTFRGALKQYVRGNAHWEAKQLDAAAISELDAAIAKFPGVTKVNYTTLTGNYQNSLYRLCIEGSGIPKFSICKPESGMKCEMSFIRCFGTCDISRVGPASTDFVSSADEAELKVAKELVAVYRELRASSKKAQTDRATAFNYVVVTECVEYRIGEVGAPDSVFFRFEKQLGRGQREQGPKAALDLTYLEKELTRVEFGFKTAKPLLEDASPANMKALGTVFGVLDGTANADSEHGKAILASLVGLEVAPEAPSIARLTVKLLPANAGAKESMVATATGELTLDCVFDKAPGDSTPLTMQPLTADQVERINQTITPVLSAEAARTTGGSSLRLRYMLGDAKYLAYNDPDVTFHPTSAKYSGKGLPTGKSLMDIDIRSVSFNGQVYEVQTNRQDSKILNVQPKRGASDRRKTRIIVYRSRARAVNIDIESDEALSLEESFPNESDRQKFMEQYNRSLVRSTRQYTDIGAFVHVTETGRRISEWLVPKNDVFGDATCKEAVVAQSAQPIIRHLSSILELLNEADPVRARGEPLFSVQAPSKPAPSSTSTPKPASVGSSASKASTSSESAAQGSKSSNGNNNNNSSNNSNANKSSHGNNRHQNSSQAVSQKSTEPPTVSYNLRQVLLDAMTRANDADRFMSNEASLDALLQVSSSPTFHVTDLIRSKSMLRELGIPECVLPFLVTNPGSDVPMDALLQYPLSSVFPQPTRGGPAFKDGLPLFSDCVRLVPPKYIENPFLDQISSGHGHIPVAAIYNCPEADLVQLLPESIRQNAIIDEQEKLLVFRNQGTRGLLLHSLYGAEYFSTVKGNRVLVRPHILDNEATWAEPSTLAGVAPGTALFTLNRFLGFVPLKPNEPIKVMRTLLKKAVFRKL